VKRKNKEERQRKNAEKQDTQTRKRRIASTSGIPDHTSTLDSMEIKTEEATEIREPVSKKKKVDATAFTFEKDSLSISDLADTLAANPNTISVLDAMVGKSELSPEGKRFIYETFRDILLRSSKSTPWEDVSLLYNNWSPERMDLEDSYEEQSGDIVIEAGNVHIKF
jgi:hypothetical protein